MWFVLALFVFGLFYIGLRLIGPARISPRAKKIAWAVLSLWWITIAASIFMGRREDGWSGGALSWLAYISLGFLSTLFFLLLIRDIILLLGLGVRAFRRRGSAAKKSVDKERRAHLLQLSNIGIVGVTGAITSYGFFEARRTPGIVEIEVPIEKLPLQFAGFRIVQITDIHAGLTVGKSWIERVVVEVKRLKPDMIVFTGDLADGSVAQLRDMVSPLAQLRAPYGKFFVTGNHEYYSGAEEWVEEVRRLGYDVLLNEHRLIERDGARLVVGGVTDFTGGRHIPSHASDPVAAFRNAPPNLVRIFLAHQPKTLAQTNGVDFDLMISGHTHGGQFFPWHLATAMDQPYLSGLHRPDGKWIYVSKGTGYWGPPVRLGARSEITVIRLGEGGVR
jgi:predicted MPP superfamily phosphohydrolase